MNETIQTRLKRNLDCSTHGHWECFCAFYIWVVIPPILLLIGTCGNFVNILVLTRKGLRKHSTSVYLLFLAFSDTTVLWTGATRNTLLRLFDKDIRDASAFTCTLHEWFAFTAGGASCWLLACLTLERTVLVRFPTFAHNHVTRRKACVLSSCVVVMLFLLSLHLVLGFRWVSGRGSEEHKCEAASPGYNDLRTKYWNVFVLVFFNVTPLILTGAGNVLIGLSLLQKRNQILPATSVQQEKARKSRAATKMLFIFTTFFLCTTLPYSIFSVYISRMPPDVSAVTLVRLQLIEAIVFTLLFSNFTFNFLFYFHFGELYRKSLKELIGTAKARIANIQCRGH